MPAMTSSVDALPAFWIVKRYRALPIDAHDVGLRREAVANPCDIFHVDGGAVDRLDRDAVQVGDRLRCRVGNVHVVFPGADLGVPVGRMRFCSADRIHDIRRRETLGLQCVRIQVHLHLALLAAIRIRHRRTRNRDELRPDEVETVVVELLL